MRAPLLRRWLVSCTIVLCILTLESGSSGSAATAAKTTQTAKAKKSTKAPAKSVKVTKSATSSLVPGGPCKTLNAHAPRSTYDCVRVGDKLLWQTRGSAANPYALTEPASVAQPNPLRSYSLGVVTPVLPLDAQRLRNLDGSPYADPPGEVAVAFEMGVTNWSGHAGDFGEPGVSLESVDQSGAAHPLIGALSCSSFADVSQLKLINLRRLAIMTTVGTVCLRVPIASLNDGLRLRFAVGPPAPGAAFSVYLRTA